MKKIETRRITPPNLGTQHIGSKIVGYRPLRQGSPQMKVEQKRDQVVIHNYGHGGSGWTLAPGAASYVNNLFLSQYRKKLTTETSIVIIGAGVLGLFTAYDLEKKGFKHITIVAEQFKDLTSHIAGGLIAPVSMENNSDIKHLIVKISVDSYIFFASIAQGKNQDFKSDCVKKLPIYFNTRQDSNLEPYVGRVMRPAKDVVLNFGNGTKRNVVAYDDGLFVDTVKTMKCLTEYLKLKGIKFVQKKIFSFQSLKEKFVFNCSGIGAAELNNDSQMRPVQGHIVMLKKQNPKHSEYLIMFYFEKRTFYFFPKRSNNSSSDDIGVIGGTFITETNPHEEEFDKIIQTAKTFYGVQKQWSLLKTSVLLYAKRIQKETRSL